jgi:phosphoribosylformimino-5-aminoimidazole carboxamide ribotide isomerase
MYIIPAIDLIDGKCVRLIQGQYHHQITYHDDPVKQAKSFINDGAKWVHVVDLDGAKLGRAINLPTVTAITKLKKLKVEVGGGIRDEAAITQVLKAGAERIIIGTKAVSDFEWFAQMAEKYKNKLALGLDAKGSKIAIEGWTKDHSFSLLDFAKEAAKLPITAIIYTDITKDGMMAGPNFEMTKTIADAVDVPVIASGGVNTIEDVKKLKELGGIEAAIIGRALYEGTLKLADAIKAAK